MSFEPKGLPFSIAAGDGDRAGTTGLGPHDRVRRRCRLRRTTCTLGELMLTFVSAQETSMEAFLSLSAASRYQGLSRGYADLLLRQGCTRPAWCRWPGGGRAGRPGRAVVDAGSVRSDRRRLDRGELGRPRSCGRDGPAEPAARAGASPRSRCAHALRRCPSRSASVPGGRGGTQS